MKISKSDWKSKDEKEISFDSPKSISLMTCSKEGKKRSEGVKIDFKGANTIYINSCHSSVCFLKASLF